MHVKKPCTKLAPAEALSQTTAPEYPLALYKSAVKKNTGENSTRANDAMGASSAGIPKASIDPVMSENISWYVRMASVMVRDSKGHVEARGAIHNNNSAYKLSDASA